MLAISKASTAAVIICVIIVGGAAFAQAPQVVSTSPAQNDLNVPTDASISVTFDVNMEAWTINLSSFVVNARSTGFHPGTISYDSETRTAVLTPFQAFTIGEVVTVVLTTDIRSAGGASLADGFSWSFTIVAPGGTGTFAAPTLSEAGHSSIVASDLNGDGALDLATQGGWVLLNNGDGTFGDPSYYNVGYAPHMIIAADLDSDGYIDLITGDEMSCVTVVLNDGSGKFPMPVQFPVKTYAPSVFAADFDNDGDMDIVTGNETADVSVLINKGDATFETHVEYAVAGPYVFVSAADFDGDGFADVAAACGNSSVVSVLLNNGDGTFASPATYSVGESCLGIYSADIDADGDCDIVTGNHDSKDVSVLLNNGDGTFAPKRSYPTGGSPWSIIAADVDGDGKLDLITAGTGYTGPDSTISVLVNEGDGTFAPYVEYQAGGNPWSVCAGDFDRDGDLDLATSYISVLFNLNPVVGVASAFPGQNELNVPISFDVSVAFDRDVDMSSVNDSTFIVHTPSAGLQEGSVSYDSLSRTATFTPDAPFHEGDMVTAVLSDGIQPLNPFHVFEPYSWSFTIEADEAFGTFVLDSAYELGEDPHYPFAADFDGDSDIDLAVSVRSWNRVAVLLNDGTGSLSAVSSYLAGTSPLDICGADADNDGDVDLFITHYGTSEITVLLGNGDGTFASPSSYDNGADNRSVAAVDLNGDRYIDLAIGNDNVSSVSIMLGTGDGTFGTAVDYSVGGWNRYVAAADFDNDGHIDLATANHSTDDISVLLNNGFGAFPERSDYNTGNHPHGIVAADLNGDAAVDLAVANWSSNNITVLLNDSTGTFTNAGNYDVGTRPTSVVGGDVDGDGDIDLVATNSGSDNMSILLNSGGGAFVTADPQYTGNTPYGICMADLDSDGDLDIVTANYVAHTISILINQNQPDMQFGNNPTTVSQGAPCSLRVEVEGYPQEALLFYRQGGDEVWQTAAMLQTEFTCCGVIPEEDVALRGLEYYFEVTKDGITGTLPESDPELYPFILKTSLTDQPGPILPGGAYRMIGFPFDVSPATARGVFEDDLGEPDASVWRLGRWNGSTGDYDEYWEVGDIHRGYGYWLVVRDQELSVDASGLSAVPDTSVGDLRFGEIVLSPGWNQISTPFAFPVSWFNRRVDLPIDPWPWEYISGTGAQTTYDTVSILEPFCGYWINNPTDSPRLLLIPYQRAGFGSVGREVSDNASEDGWELILSLNSAGLADRTNVAGVRAGALDGADEYDFCEPPLPPGEYISLAFLGNTEKGKERLLAGDYRPVESDGWIFDILVRGNTGETASIALSEPAQMPSGILTVFEDPSSGDSYQILPGVSLTIPHVLSQEGQAYRLIVGSQEYVDGLELNPLMMPAEFALEQNCPNPFNPLTAMDYSVPVPCHVKISIYNLLGQKIKTVVDEDKPAGSHTAFWDGTDSNGAEAATGVYFYQIEAGDFIKSRKMLLLK